MTKGRWEKSATKRGHNSEDPMCELYVGEFDGMDPNAVCSTCRSRVPK